MATGELARLARVTLMDARRAADTLARAFQVDPLMRYAIPDDGERRRLLPFLVGLNVRYGCRYGEVYATPDYAGVAVWLPPRQTTVSRGRMLRVGMFAAVARMRWTILRRLNAAGRRAATLHERHAPGQHWYLSQIGVEPSRQGQGIASRLIRPMLARCDAARLPCYLETENEANVARYQWFGFRVVADEMVGDGGPHIWAMLRNPFSGGGYDPAQDETRFQDAHRLDIARPIGISPSPEANQRLSV